MGVSGQSNPTNFKQFCAISLFGTELSCTGRRCIVIFITYRSETANEQRDITLSSLRTMLRYVQVESVAQSEVHVSYDRGSTKKHIFTQMTQHLARMLTTVQNFANLP